MREKIYVRVRLPATQCFYEFRIPHDLDVMTVARLMSRLLSTKEGPRYRFDEKAMLMLLDGRRAGDLLKGTETIGHLVFEGILTDGTSLALV
jgi:hypothetical protein